MILKFLSTMCNNFDSHNRAKVVPKRKIRGQRATVVLQTGRNLWYHRVSKDVVRADARRADWF